MTRVQVFYPTLEPANCQTKYTIQGVNGSYQRSSLLCAVQDAGIASGPHKLIVHDHGGGAGPDHQRISQLPVHETLASHGFVVALARHSASAVARVVDLPLVIDFMLAASNPLSAEIDPDSVGLSGFSSGGVATFTAATGWTAQGILPEPRVKAVINYEGMPPNSMADAVNLSIPYMAMGGSRFAAALAIPPVFAATVLANPRIYVQIPEALHFNFQTDLCTSINETREIALQLDPNQAEPLTNLVPTQTTVRACNTAMGAAALQACTFWNQGELVYLTIGFAFGGGRNICDRTGVNSIRSLDEDPVDGFTDSFLPGTDIPLFEPNDAFNSTETTTEEPPPAEVTVPLITHYTVAFWKKYLEGDGRYMRFLTPGYAKVHGLEAVVDIRE